MDKIVVILGPTASGKSSLGISLARKFNGEVVSADSRQVYKGMDVGTGKVTKAEQKTVPHHLLDVASPKRQFTVAQYKRLARKAIGQILENGKLPFLVGGTPFYIYSLIDDLELPQAKPDAKLRKSLEKKSAAELFAMLSKIDPIRAKSIDRHNKVRLVRAIEINKRTGQPVPDLKRRPAYDALIIGISKPQEELYSLIDKRLEARLKQGMVEEVKRLLKSGISYKKLEAFGLEYRYLSKFLKGQIGKNEMIDQLKNAIHHFSRRQMTWFKRDMRIHWVKNLRQAEALVRKFR